MDGYADEPILVYSESDSDDSSIIYVHSATPDSPDSPDSPDLELDSESQTCLDILHEAPHVLVFSGAGISAAPPANLPVFRGGPDAFRQRDWDYDVIFTPFYSHLRHYGSLDRAMRHSPDLTAFMKRMARFRLRAEDALPTGFHRWVRKTEEEGRLVADITTNIDGLDTAAGVLEDTLIELHGDVHYMVCESCHTETQFTPADAEAILESQDGLIMHSDCQRISGSRSRPRSAIANNFFRPKVILYGDDPWNKDIAATVKDLMVPRDTVLVIAGASLAAKPTQKLIRGIIAHVTEVIIINQQRLNVKGLEHALYLWGAIEDHF